MNLEQTIKQRLQTKFLDGEVTVNLQGNAARLDVVSNEFQGLSPLRRQQLVYSCINDLIQSGELHAVTINATTIN